MNSKPTKIPCIVDALSFTWSPKELLRIKEMAKIGACVKGDIITKARDASLNRELAKLETQRDKDLLAAPAFNTHDYQNILNRYKDSCDRITREYNNRRHKDLPLKSLALSENEVSARYELRDMLKPQGLEVDTSTKYGDRLNNLLDNIGIDLLDVLGCGEVERFVCRLNNVFTQETYIWTVKNNPTGRSNYSYSATLYADGETAGIICWGGKNLGCYVSFMGTGCNALDLPRLYEEIKKIPALKITRIDLAHDDHAGKHSIKRALTKAKKGQFNSGGRPASYMYVESGHLSEKQLKENFQVLKEQSGQKSKSTAKKTFGFIPSKGKTLYIGSRESGKLLRIYEKGKQLGEKNSKWVRWEVELHSSQRVIPLDAMIKPSEYLAATYPALSFLSAEQCKIKTTIKQTTMTIERIVENQVTNTRKAINMMRLICGMNDSEIVETFLKDIEEPDCRSSMPSRLKVPIFEEWVLKQNESAAA
jgi:DNA relaxase NicK